jgi:hypothetical protein
MYLNKHYMQYSVAITNNICKISNDLSVTVTVYCSVALLGRSNARCFDGALL